MTTRTYKLASEAHGRVGAVSDAMLAEYSTLCRRAGAFVRISGLVAFVAFLRSKSGREFNNTNPHSRLLQDMGGHWAGLGVVDQTALGTPATILEWLREASLPNHMRATRTSLLLLGWLRRCCDARATTATVEGCSAKGGEIAEEPSPARRGGVARILDYGFDTGHNPGLAFGKYLRAFGEAPEIRLEVLGAFFRCRPSEAYRRVFTGHLARLEAASARSGSEIETFELITASRLVIGLGARGALDFGLTFHPVYGTPFIPGSSLKGVASAHAARVGGPGWAKSVGAEDEARLMSVEVFGGLLGRRLWSGSVAFFDAWWVPGNGAASPYELEIVNPHYSGYHAGGENQRAPDGLESPVPFTYIALRAGERFHFALGGPAEVRGVARKILEHALAEVGVGGKTALGYGRFQPSSDKRADVGHSKNPSA